MAIIRLLYTHLRDGVCHIYCTVPGCLWQIDSRDHDDVHAEALKHHYSHR